MPIYKLDALERDAEKVDGWLLANGIVPENCFAPSFIDTDANVFHWTLVVSPANAEPVEGGPVYPCVAGYQLHQYGLLAPAAGTAEQRLGLQMQTPLVVPFPVELGGSELSHKWDDYFNAVAAATGEGGQP